MNRTAVVTGAGSGVGRAVAHALASEGWSVALVGRTAATLQETIATAAPELRERFLACIADVGHEVDVTAMAGRVRDRLGDPTVLVNSAGANIAARVLDVLSPDDFRRLIEINLTGAFLCVHAFLPGMRRQGNGTIVNVISDAGVLANATAGAAYVAGKFGLTGLTQSINIEQRDHGIRATALLPGEINTPLLDKRPVPPPQDVRHKMLQPEDVAACALLAINLPHRATIEQLLIRPRETRR